MPHLRPHPAFLLLAAILAALGSDSPQAADEKGTIVAATDVYSGPGRYPILGRVKRGEQVQLAGCDAGHNWCEISAGKVHGWISGNAFEISTKARPAK